MCKLKKDSLSTRDNLINMFRVVNTAEPAVIRLIIRPFFTRTRITLDDSPR